MSMPIDVWVMEEKYNTYTTSTYKEGNEADWAHPCGL